MSFVDASHGFGLTYPGVVAATTDGGASWVTKSRLPGPPDGHGKIVFLDRADGAALFDGLLVTHDGGTTWATTPITRASDVAAAGTSLWAFVAELCFSDQPLHHAIELRSTGSQRNPASPAARTRSAVLSGARRARNTCMTGAAIPRTKPIRSQPTTGVTGPAAEASGKGAHELSSHSASGGSGSV